MDSQLVKRQREELVIAKKSECSFSHCFKYFFSTTNVIYYENENGDFVGAVTFGDFIRAIKSRKEISINTQFTKFSCHEDYMLHIKEVFQKKPMVNIYPVLDGTRLVFDMKRVRGSFTNDQHINWDEVDQEDLRALLGNDRLCVIAGRGERWTSFVDFAKGVTKIEFINCVEEIYEQNPKDVIVYDGFLSEITVADITLVQIDLLYSALLAIKAMRYMKKFHVSYYFFELQMARKLNFYNRADKVSTILYGLSEIASDKEFLEENFAGEDRQYFINKDYAKIARIYEHGVYMLPQIVSETYNALDGRRVTLGCPEVFNQTVHVYGPCVVEGTFSSDAGTICSLLQKKYENTRVLNHGVVSLLLTDSNEFKKILQTKFNPQGGDIVAHLSFSSWNTWLFRRIALERYYEMSFLFNGNIQKRCFLDTIYHLTPYATSLLADYVDQIIRPELGEGVKCVTKEEFQVAGVQVTEEDVTLPEGLTKYCEEIQQYKFEHTHNKKIGCVVMNCNPFTNGHYYLINQSLNIVDFLYVFVVEEDKSFFPFSDRLNLVKEGCKQHDNVRVIASGNYIISNETFPEYFVKDQLTEITINPTNDLRIFGRFIAPALDITYRFAGEEPFDKVTKQYNEAMKRVLKEYNIDFIEMKRRSIGDDIISATTVRKLYEEQNWEKITQYVPKTTLKHLKEKFNKNN